VKLGFVGAGRMGLPMVHRLRAAGHMVRVLARSPQARERLTAAGLPAADLVGTAGEAADGAAALMVCVHTDAQVREVCLGGALDRLPGGALLIVHTTGDPGTVEEIARAHRGIAVVDAPVSGGPAQAATGALTVFAGGAADALERALPLLRTYADPVLTVGPLGAGQRVKLVNNALFAATTALVADAVALGARLGLDEATLLAALSHGSASSRALSLAAGFGSAGALAGGLGGFLGKDVAIVREVAARLGADLGAIGQALASSSGTAVLGQAAGR
jgi:2-hydroxy-3-oxopropionate reductase